MTHLTAVAVLCIMVGGVGAQWVAARLRLPAIVLLFGFGLLIGPVLQLFQPAVAFGPGLRPLVGLAVAIVVFEGGLALDVRELRAAGDGVFRLTVVALPISFVLATLVAYVVGKLSGEAAFLYGAITVVTGPTVVLPLLRNTKLRARPASFFKWEAIVNDPIGALMAAVVLAVMVAGGHHGSALVGEVVAGLLAAAALGIGGALLFRWLIQHDLVGETLKTPMLLAFALAVDVLSNLVMEDTGLGAATILGIALANMKIRGLAELTRVKESLVVLIVSALFIVLTASLDRGLFAQLTLPTYLLTAAMILLVRPATIALATIGSDLTWRERLLTGWIAPRGIVAAAVASVAGGRLSAAGHAGGEAVMPAVFTLIASTMILHGFSLAPLARRLKLTLGDKPTLAIIGATPWTETLAQTLSKAGTPVLLIDSFNGALDHARGKGLTTLQAELLSEHGIESLREHRIDYLFAATQNDIYNSLVCAKLAPEIGRGKVFQLAEAGEPRDAGAGLDAEWRGHVVGVPPLGFADMAGSRHSTASRFFLEELKAGDDLEDDEMALMIVRSNGGLVFVSAEMPEVEFVEGDRVLRVLRPRSAATAGAATGGATLEPDVAASPA